MKYYVLELFLIADLIIKMAQTPANLKLKILAIVGSVREGKMAGRVVKLIENFYKDKEDGHTLEILG